MFPVDRRGGRKMRVAFLLRRFPALSETFILNQITGLIDLGHTVDIRHTMSCKDPRNHPEVEAYGLLRRARPVFCPRDLPARLWGGMARLADGLFHDPGLILNSLNVFRYGREAASLRLLYLASGFRGSWDILHCHYGMLGNPGVRVRDAGASVGPVVTSFHGFDMTSYVREHGSDVYSYLFERGDLFLPVSEHWRKRLIEMGCPPDKIRVHRMGVDCERLEFTARSLRPGQPVELVSVARLVEKKGIEYGIRAVGALIEEGVDLRYTIVGDGELREDLEELARRLDSSGRISFAGWMPQNELLKLLRSSHLLLAPSVTARSGDQEGIPVVLMEAMAVGMPVVSTTHSGIPELVEDGRSGLLVPERDVGALTEAVRKLTRDPGCWSRIGIAGRRRVEEEFDLKKQVSRLEAIYREVVSEARCR
ncbi:glycosyltransferase [Candidatus Fermentibacteria bacterium]|nr:glycosyltransferase [Candidatus Fermentibacteria bacterium]